VGNLVPIYNDMKIAFNRKILPVGANFGKIKEKNNGSNNHDMVNSDCFCIMILNGRSLISVIIVLQALQLCLLLSVYIHKKVFL
jgi:hypothetical protein